MQPFPPPGPHGPPGPPHYGPPQYGAPPTGPPQYVGPPPYDQPPPGQPPAHDPQVRHLQPPRPRRPVRSAFTMILVVALLGGLVVGIREVLKRWPEADRASSMAPDATADLNADQRDVEPRTQRTDVPSPSKEESDVPVGTPPPLPAEDGAFAFMDHQPGDDNKPVAYDPCRPIHFIVNAASAPPGGQAMVASAITKLSRATGLSFRNDGDTTATDSDGDDAFLPDLYGDRWAPVLIWWTTPEEAPRLAGLVVGYGGSTSVSWNPPLGQQARVFVTGSLVLDSPGLAAMMASPRQGADFALAVILHELGHVIGLDHVDDPDQLMYPEQTGEVLDYAPGDLRGLNALGRGECFPGI